MEAETVEEECNLPFMPKLLPELPEKEPVVFFFDTFISADVAVESVGVHDAAYSH
jgi:hypothetical protein